MTQSRLTDTDEPTDNQTRYDEPKASEFGVDDRPEATRRNSDDSSDDGKQSELFPSMPKTDDIDDGQATLGTPKNDHCPFENSNDSDDDRDIRTQTVTDEYDNEHVIHYDRNHEHCATIEKHPAELSEHCEYCDNSED